MFDIALGHEQERAAARNPYGLTTGELQMCRLLRDGGSAADIAAQFGIDAGEFGRLYAGLMEKLRAQSDEQLQHLLCVLKSEPLEQPKIVYVDDFRTSFSLPPAEHPVEPDDVVFAP